jgi:hypothetical protein
MDSPATGRGRPVASYPQGLRGMALQPIIVSWCSWYVKLVVTLSFVADDVAIPYLVEIASAGGFGSGVGVEGLVRIGDLQAVSALASFPHGKGRLILLLGSTSREPVEAAIRDALARSSPSSHISPPGSITRGMATTTTTTTAIARSL